MIHRTKKKFIAIPAALTAVMMLSACAGMQERVSNIGKPPAMTSIQSGYDRPQQAVRLPMPPQEERNTAANSLWQPSRQTFFKDQRAHKVGDILTILIDMKDEADLKNKTQRSRTGTENVGVPNVLGLESYLGKVLPGAVDPSNLMTTSSNHNTAGDGKIEREEEIKLSMAAMITEVLPNGNFVIRGRQEVRVNFELRELTLDGIIRPEDILNNNSISHEKIAEARISYGGRGQVSEIQQPRYGQQFFDAVMPF